RTVGARAERRGAEGERDGEHERDGQDSRRPGPARGAPCRPSILKTCAEHAVRGGGDAQVAIAAQCARHPLVADRRTHEEVTSARASTGANTSSLRSRSSPRCCRFQICFSDLSRSLATSTAGYPSTKRSRITSRYSV